MTADLTKITTPFGLLKHTDPEAAEALKAWPHGYEYWSVSTESWCATDNLQDAHGLVYRAKPAPLTKPSIDWSILPDDCGWLAKDGSGCAYAHGREPDRFTSGWFSGSATLIRVDQLTCYTPGTCDWKDSLVQRPEATP